MPNGSPFRSPRSRAPRFVTALALLGLATVGAASPGARPRVALCRAPQPMSESEMAAATAAWFRAVPPHASGVASATTASAPVDTFLAFNFLFNADHRTATLIDTVHIAPGQSVLFQWTGGSHTTTSGNPGDADAGSLWNFPLNSTHPQVTISLSIPGTYPFFCAPHAAFGMQGVIIVDDTATPARPSTWGAIKARYR